MDHIRVWKFDDAAKELRDLSGNGGDEDWIALVPPHLVNEHIWWLEPGSPFGCCDVERHELPDGSAVFIGCHA